MYDRTTTRDTDQELIEVLTAISVVSKRLAIKLARIQAMKTEDSYRYHTNNSHAPPNVMQKQPRRRLLWPNGNTAFSPAESRKRT